MAETIPFLDLPAQHAPLLSALQEGFTRAVKSAAFIGGSEVAAFEQAFARHCQVEQCVGVANGTDALALSLHVLGVGPGDVVLVPAFTFIATAGAVVARGATPRLVDIDPMTYNLDPEALTRADLRGVKGIIAVHLYGQPANIAAIKAFASAHKLFVLEDCAQAHGASVNGRPVGSLADLAAFSFYPGKNLGALGDGGAVVGNNAALLERVRRLANHGRTTHSEHNEFGLNSRLDALQAMALRIKLEHLPAWNQSRDEVAGWYDAAFARVPEVTTPARVPGNTHVYHIYCLQVPERDRVHAALKEVGIQTGVHYPIALYEQPAFASLGYRASDFPVARALAQRCLSLPMFPGLRRDQVERVVAAVAELVRGRR
jgi:dTDP-4-amino-4,6-dideoxygalactose transaminase